MLVNSIFSFSHNVFRRLFTQGRLKSGLCGKELKKYIEHVISATFLKLAQEDMDWQS